MTTIVPGSKFFIPSYLDPSNANEDFKLLADSMGVVTGPVTIKKVLPGYTMQVKDANKMLRLDKGGEVIVPMDSSSDVVLDNGTQIAILNYSDERVKIVGEGSVVIVSGSDRNVVDKWKVGLLMKYNANLWLLSLGSGSTGVNAVPTEPNLVSAVGGIKRATLTWEKPVDDGGFPVIGYIIEQSVDKKKWIEAARPGLVLTTTVNVAEPGTYFFRVKAFNEVGESNPSNVLAAQVTFQSPTLDHGGASSNFVITNYDPTNSYIISSTSGTAQVAGNIVTTARNDKITLQAKAGTVVSAAIYLETTPVTGYNTSRRVYCGGCNCRTDVNPHTWDCGCACGRCDCADAGSGAYGDCTCGNGYVNDWNDNPCPAGFNQWGRGDAGGDWWRTSATPLAPLKMGPRATGITLNEHGLSGFIRAPWRTYKDGDILPGIADTSIFHVMNDKGESVIAITPDWDENIGYTWDEDEKCIWLGINVRDTELEKQISGSLRWEFLAQTAHVGRDSWPEIVVHLDGEVTQ